MPIHLCTHIAPDGDALGSVFAVRELLVAAGVESVVHLWGDIPRWFPAVAGLLGSPPWTDAPVTEGPVWLLDASGPGRCGEGTLPAGVAIDVLIDHHLDEGTPAVCFHAVRPEASSACELLAGLTGWQALGAAGVAWPGLTASAAGWLYLGLRTDSLSFATTTTTDHTHNHAAALIRAGAPHAAIARALHGSLSRELLGFQSWVIANAVWVAGSAVCVADVVTRRRFGVSASDAKVVLSAVTQVAELELAVLLIEADDGRSLVSLRSPGSGLALALARVLGGGGHPQAAGAAVLRPLWEVHGELIAALQKGGR